MPGEIQTVQTTGLVHYAVLIGPTGQVFNGTAFEAPLAANWSTYTIVMAEQSTTGIYLGTMPVVTAGLYRVVVYHQAGGFPDPTDSLVVAGSLPWTGTAVETPGVGGTVTLGATAPDGWIGTTTFVSGALVPADVQKVKGGDPVPLATPIQATLVATALDQIDPTLSAGTPTTFRTKLLWFIQNLWESDKTPTAKHVKSGGVTLTTQTVSDDGNGTESLGPPT